MARELSLLHSGQGFLERVREAYKKCRKRKFSLGDSLKRTRKSAGGSRRAGTLC